MKEKEKREISRQMLLDDFHMNGVDAFELAEVIKLLSDCTRVYTIPGGAPMFYNIMNNGDEDILKACPADVQTHGSGRFVKLSLLRAKNSPVHAWPEELWDEAINRSRIFIGFSNDRGEQKLMPVTCKIGSDFAGVGITGSAAQRASYHLLGLVAEQLADKPYVTFVARSCNNTDEIEKVITMRSGNYELFPQDETLALATQICSDGDIAYWDVTNFLTEVVYSFPKHATATSFGRKKGNFLPYIRYTNSDSGDSSCAFELGWNINGRSVFLASGANRVFRTHRSEWNQALRDSLYADALKLRDKFVVLADRMAELQTIIVLNQNIDRVVKHLCSDTKITGKAIQEAFVSHVTDEFVGTDATAAEIVLSMIEAQDTNPVLNDLSDIQKVALKHKLGELPYQRIRQKI